MKTATASKLNLIISTFITNLKKGKIEVNYNELMTCPVMEFVDKFGYKMKRFPTDVSRSLLFQVNLLAGQEISDHYHNCKERIFVHEGSVIDKISKRIYAKGEVLFFYEGTPHGLIAVYDCEIFVEYLPKI